MAIARSLFTAATCSSSFPFNLPFSRLTFSSPWCNQRTLHPFLTSAQRVCWCSQCLSNSRSFSVRVPAEILSHCLYESPTSSLHLHSLDSSRQPRRHFFANGVSGRALKRGLWQQEQRIPWRRENVKRLCLSSTESKEITFNFAVSVDDSTTVDSHLEAVIEQLEVDGPLAVKLAIDGIEDLEDSESVELSVMLCGDTCIQDLNKQWRGKETPTDVLSFPQDQLPGLTPILLLGDVVISVETAARQAKERGHSLIDELRILLVHGLLHVLGYDHELGPEASQEMEEEETRILGSLGWEGNGLISVSLEDEVSLGSDGGVPNGVLSESDSGAGGVARTRKPAFKILFCDMDGTILDTKSKVTQGTADALRAAIAMGVQVIIATGKTRPAALAALETVGLTGDRGALSLTSPGVFLQGLQVYGRDGTIVHSQLLDSDIVSEAFRFSVEHQAPLVGFSGDRCVTLFGHTLIDKLHDVYYEPKAEVMESLGLLKKAVQIQKVLFYDSAERVANFLRPHWSLVTRGRATVVQALPEMMEILPIGASKGAGVKLLLDHLGIPPEEVMAIGDGENDIEMLQMAGWGVAMANGAARTLSVAKAITASNDEDGVAQAIHKYIL